MIHPFFQCAIVELRGNREEHSNKGKKGKKEGNVWLMVDLLYSPQSTDDFYCFNLRQDFINKFITFIIV